jgi:hypothetical protein
MKGRTKKNEGKEATHHTVFMQGQHTLVYHNPPIPPVQFFPSLGLGYQSLTGSELIPPTLQYLPASRPDIASQRGREKDLDPRFEIGPGIMDDDFAG